MRHSAMSGFVGLVALACTVPDGPEPDEPDCIGCDEDQNPCQDGACGGPLPAAPDACEGCAVFEACEDERCLVQGASRWDVIAESAQVPERKPDGNPWDTNALSLSEGKPDPYLVISGQDGVVVTEQADDTENPRWSTPLLYGVTADSLVAGCAVEIYDQDLVFDDVMASCTVSIPRHGFFDGAHLVDCQEVRLRLVLRPVGDG